MALLQLCSQPTAFFAALEVDCKSLTLRHCGTWLESQRCNFTMPKRKPLLAPLSSLSNCTLQLYHAKAETRLALSMRVRLRWLQLYHAKAETRGKDGQGQHWAGLQLYHAKAETRGVPPGSYERLIVATLPCQSGNAHVR